MTTCPSCGFQSPSDTDCLGCGIIFAKYVPPIPGWSPPKEKSRAVNKVELDDVRVLVFALPGAIVLAWLAKHFFLTRALFGGIGIWIHEFGHATLGWLSGRASTPLPIGWTNFEQERSLWVAACFAFLLGLAIWKSIGKKVWGVVAVLGVLFLLQLRFTFGLNENQFSFLMSYAGVGGEIYLGAILMALFYLRIPGKPFWDYLRYVVLVIGAYSFVNTFRTWIAISQDQASIPWGSLFAGESDGNGDMNQLYDQFGWTKKEIIRLYLRTGVICAWGLVAVYVAGLARYFTRKRKEIHG
jgi:hypothetical protein